MAAGENFKVRLEPAGLTFTVEPGETVLNGALRARIPLKYGCRHGNCSTCIYLVVDGEVDFGNASPYALSLADREEGWALMCQARPLCDLVIRDADEPEIGLRPLISPSEQRAEIEGTDRLGGTLHRIRLALERPLAFYAGQFVEVAVPGRPGEWRSYSIASPPSRPKDIELIIKRIPDGAFSGQVDSLAVGSTLLLRGPYGASYLRDSGRPALMVAAGSGIAPIRSMLLHAADTGDRRGFTCFFGACTRDNLVLVEECEQLEARLHNFRFVPALSKPTPQCRWEGPVGRVTYRIQREIADASPYDAYVCGAPEMCGAVAALLAAKGIGDGRICFERFYPA